MDCFLNYNETEIEYTLERKKVKNINMRIYPDGKVFVSANRHVPQSVIDGFVLRNAHRIISARKKFSEKPSLGDSLKSGCTVSVLGREYSLRVNDCAQNSYSFTDGEITLYVRGADVYENRLSVFDSLLFDTAKRIFPELLEECYPRFSAVCKTLPELRIRKMKSQWGSCYHNRNIITLNSRLAAFDKDVIRFVIFHEYCHFIYHDHSAAFYALLAQVCPDWKKRKEKLKMIK